MYTFETLRKKIGSTYGILYCECVENTHDGSVCFKILTNNTFKTVYFIVTEEDENTISLDFIPPKEIEGVDLQFMGRTTLKGAVSVLAQGVVEVITKGLDILQTEGIFELVKLSANNEKSTVTLSTSVRGILNTWDYLKVTEGYVLHIVRWACGIPYEEYSITDKGHLETRKLTADEIVKRTLLSVPVRTVKEVKEILEQLDYLERGIKGIKEDIKRVETDGSSVLYSSIDSAFNSLEIDYHEIELCKLVKEYSRVVNQQ